MQVLAPILVALLPLLSPLVTAGVKKLVGLMDTELPNEIKPLVNAAAGMVIATATALATGNPDTVAPAAILPAGLAGALVGAKVRDQYNARQDAKKKLA